MKKSNYLFWIAFIEIAIFFVVDWLLWDKTIYSLNASYGTIGQCLLALEIIYFRYSFKTIGPKEQGALLLFGKPICNLSSGLNFAPLFIFRIKTESRLTFQFQFPDEPENIWRGDEKKEKKPDGMVLPFRVTHAPKRKEEEKKKRETEKKETSSDSDSGPDPLDIRMTTEVMVFIRLTIEDYVRFLIKVGDIDNLRSQMKDTTEAAIKEDLGKKTPAEAIDSLEEINSTLKASIRKFVRQDKSIKNNDEWWGVNIEDAKITDIDLGKTVNEALRDVPSAEYKKKAAIIESEGEKKSAINRAEGEAEAIKLVSESADKYFTGNAQVFKKLETLENSLKNNAKIVVPANSELINVIGDMSGVPLIKTEEKKGKKEKEDKK